MADNVEIGDLVAKISFDDTGLNKSLAAINREMKLVESEFARASSSLDDYGDEEEKVKAKTDLLNKQMQLQQQRINRVNDALQKSIKEKGSDAKETQQLAIQLNKAQATYNKLDKEIRDTNDSLTNQDKDVKKTDSAWGSLTGSLGGSLEGLAALAGPAGIAAVGAGLVALGVSAVNFAGDFESALNGLKTATGDYTDANGELEDSLLSLYNQNFGTGFDDIADSMATVKQITGETGKELEGLTKDAFLVRDAFGADVSESVKAADSLIKKFGITGDEAFTLIAQGFQNGADRSGDFLDSLNEYAVQFQSLGFDADQFVNVLIDGAKDGAFQINKVGDAVKEFNIRVKDGSKTTTDAFESLGLDAEATAAAFAAGGDKAQVAFQQVINGLAGIEDPLEQNRIGVELFGTQFEDLQASGVLALQEIGSTADSTKDTLDQINDVQYDDANHAIQGIGRNLKTAILLPLGEDVLPLLQEFSDFLINNMPEIQRATHVTFLSMNSDLESFANELSRNGDGTDNWLGKLDVSYNEALFATQDWIKDTSKELSDAVSEFFKVGGQIGQGLIDGLTSKARKLRDEARIMAHDLKEALGDIFHFGSPSKVTTQMGEWIGEGLQIGMSNSMNGVSRQAAELSEAALPSTSPTSFSAKVNGAAQSAAQPAEAAQQTTVVPVYLDSKKIAEAISGPLADLTRIRTRGMGLT